MCVHVSCVCVCVEERCVSGRGRRCTGVSGWVWMFACIPTKYTETFLRLVNSISQVE